MVNDSTALRIISGGQTGVDRAALDVALVLGLPCGGWCPRGRLAENGPIPDHYPLAETPSHKYAQRTRFNVRDSDGTLVLTRGDPAGGTALTIGFAAEFGRPCKVIDLNEQPDPAAIAEWISANRIIALNIAGPRESTAPGVYADALEFLFGLLKHAAER